jgi:D-alanyl-D-alanine carboxypeptidase (penicillin-binding protein 5/6)
VLSSPVFAFVLLFAAWHRLRWRNCSRPAPQAYMIDADTGTVLFAKNENDLVPPASLAKLMTMEVVFNAIRSGRLTLEDTFQVSENAWRTGGAMSRTSTMFAELKSSIRLEDLIQGVIVQSANDGCIIIAEGMAGSEDNFARLMTERAREIGLTQSTFGNSSGLPHPDSKVSMKDLVTLARHIQRPIRSSTGITRSRISPGTTSASAIAIRFSTSTSASTE